MCRWVRLVDAGFSPTCISSCATSVNLTSLKRETLCTKLKVSFLSLFCCRELPRVYKLSLSQLFTLMFWEPEQIRWELLAAVLCWKYIARRHFNFTENVFACQETTIFLVRALFSAVSSEICTQNYSFANSPPCVEYQECHPSATIWYPIQIWSTHELQAVHQSSYWLWTWPSGPPDLLQVFGASPWWLQATGQDLHFWELPESAPALCQRCCKDWT